jgi:hypothetical protein
VLRVTPCRLEHPATERAVKAAPVAKCFANSRHRDASTTNERMSIKAK